MQPLLQDVYSVFEVISDIHHKINIIDVVLTAKAMSKVVLWINRCPELVTVWAFKTKKAFNKF